MENNIDFELFYYNVCGKLWAYYEDFKESSNDAPDAELCEVYRAQLDNIYKLLLKEGAVFKRR